MWGETKTHSFRRGASIIHSSIVHVLCPQHKVDNDCSQQGHRQNTRPEPIVETTLAPLAYTLGTPMERDKGVDHCSHRDEGEQSGADAADAVTEVEQADGEAAEDDGEVQP